MIADDDIRLTDLGATLLSTQGGHIETGIGTPLYMSPEQLPGRSLELRSGMLSLAIVFYELLTGVKPYEAFSIDSLVYQILNTKSPPLGEMRLSVPKDLDGIVARMMATSPSQRYASWKECIDALATIKQPSRRTRAACQPQQCQRALPAVARVAILRDLLRRRPLVCARNLHIPAHRRGRCRRFPPDAAERPGANLETQPPDRPGVARHEAGRDFLCARRPYTAQHYLRGTEDGTVMRIEDAVPQNSTETCRSRFEKTFLKTMASWLMDANKPLNSMP